MLYKYCRPDGIDILNNSRLKVAPALRLNDPFDMSIVFDVDNARQNLKNELGDLPVLQNICEKYGLLFNKHEQDSCIDNVVDVIIRNRKDVVEYIRNKTLMHWGIVCFSKNYCIIPMWTYYTQNHEGIVVGFRDNMIEPNRIDVEYYESEDRTLFPVSVFKESLSGNDIKNSYRHKNSDWQHEKEVRVLVRLEKLTHDRTFNPFLDISPENIKELHLKVKNEKDINLVNIEPGTITELSISVPAGEEYYVNVDSSEITEVYLGLNAKPQFIDEVKTVLARREYSHVKLYKMEKHQSKYELKVVDMPNDSRPKP